MKKLVLALAASAAFASSALAADLPPPPPPAVVPEPEFSWEHTIYIGLQAGYGIGYKDWIYEPPLGNNSHTVRGWLAGVQAGINVQRRNFVIGAEADWNWSNITGSVNCEDLVTFCSSDINWIATWTARAGMMAGPVLLYVEGGVAVANETFSDTEGADVDSVTANNRGWTIGGGGEFKVGNGWAIDLEYSYVNFGTDTYSIDGDPVTVTQSLHMLRLGVNRLF